MRKKTILNIALLAVLAVTVAAEWGSNDLMKQEAQVCKAGNEFQYPHPEYWHFYRNIDGACCTYGLVEGKIQKVCT